MFVHYFCTEQLSTMENITSNTELIKSLKGLLFKGHAHVSLEDALANIPEDALGKVPKNLPYRIWQLTEHIRITQWDMLGFSKSPKHKSPKWPEEYWPKEKAPANKEAWENCIKQIKKDRKSFLALLEKENADLFTPFAHGTGQTLLQEALQIADHTSYHTGEIIAVRRLLGEWK